MNCKTCGKPLEEGAISCRNCGTTLSEMGILPEKPQKVELSKEDDAKSEFQKNADRFGGIEVKERRASLMAGVDTKFLSMGLVLVMLIIFCIAKVVFDHKTTTISLDDVKVTLPSSMRSVDDYSFEVYQSKMCRSFSNSDLEFTCIKYDAKALIPGLSNIPDDNDIEGLTSYYGALSKLGNMEKDFAEELDEIFAEDLNNYECLELKKGKLDFTYSDDAMVGNYVAMRIMVKDQSIYQISLLCSEDSKDRLSKKFDDILKSLEIK